MKTLKKIVQVLFVLTMGFFLGIEVMIGIWKRHKPQFERGGTPGSQKVETLIKAIVDTILFLISYSIQQRFVFSSKSKT